MKIRCHQEKLFTNRSSIIYILSNISKQWKIQRFTTYTSRQNEVTIRHKVIVRHKGVTIRHKKDHHSQQVNFDGSSDNHVSTN